MRRAGLGCVVTVGMLISITGWAQPESGKAFDFSVRNYAGIQRGGHFAIEFKNAELKEAVRFLAKIEQMNVVIPEGVEAMVNASFSDTTVMDAINSIVKANSLDFAIENNILRVGNNTDFQSNEEDLKTETIRLKYASAADLKDRLSELLSERGSVVADERTNSLVIRERLAGIDNIRNFLENIDIRDTQVKIEAKIVEVTRDFSRSLGIQWGVNTNGNRADVIGSVGTGASGNPLNVNMGAENPTSAVGLMIGTLAGGTNIDALLSAAEERGDAHVVSEPTIVTSNGIEAKIRSGESIYVKTTGDVTIGSGDSSTTASGNSGLQQITTGVEMQVTPQVSPDDAIKLKIDAQTSQPDFSRAVDGIPAIVDNVASTTVLVRDGETTIIGGLAKYTGSNTKKRVPLLSKIPLLGNLFKNSNKSKQNTELMIFIRPVIVAQHEDIQHRMDYVDQLKQYMTVPEEEVKAAKKQPLQSPDNQVDSENEARRNWRFKNRHIRD